MENDTQTTQAQQISLSRRKMMKLAVGVSAATLVAPQIAHAAKSAIYTSRFSNTAVGGFDTVAYFTAGEPVKGSKKYVIKHKGAKWQFSSQENLDLFAANPKKYAPAYGGYCAYAVALGSTTKGDPQQWEIFEDTLYLNVNAKIQKKWSANKPDYIAKSEANWPIVLS